MDKMNREGEEYWQEHCGHCDKTTDIRVCPSCKKAYCSEFIDLDGDWWCERCAEV